MTVENDLVWVSVKINSVLVLTHPNQLDIRAGIEIEVISVMCSKLCWFLCWGSKLIFLLCSDRLSIGFDVWIEIDLVLVRGSRLAFFLCGPKMIFF